MAGTCLRPIFTVGPFWINSERASFEKVTVGQRTGNLHTGTHLANRHGTGFQVGGEQSALAARGCAVSHGARWEGVKPCVEGRAEDPGFYVSG